MKFKFHFILLPLLAMTLASCMSASRRMERFYTTLLEAKKSSLSRWEEATPLAFVGLRTGMILEGAEFMTLTNSHVTAEGNFTLRYRIDKDHASKMTIGSMARDKQASNLLFVM